jgi:streptomycin 6-kinase
VKKIDRVDLPQYFITTIRNTFGERGSGFLNSLPGLVDEASRRWNLTKLQTVPNLSYNYVAFAQRPISGSRQPEEVVLKIGVPDRELTSEMTALHFLNGRGTVRLFDADQDLGMFLLERLRPGEMLATLENDEQATQIAAEVMLKLWQPAPAGDALLRLSDWFKGFARLRSRFGGGTGPLDEDLFERAEEAVKELFAEEFTPMLIHGDLHHFNILSSKRGWLAIDPKGVIGPAAYEVGPLLLNPWNKVNDSPEWLKLTKRRIAVLSERLGFERERIRKWGLAHAVLSAWWSLEADEPWEYPMDCARLFSKVHD